MRLQDLISESGICLKISETDKNRVIERLIGLQKNSLNITDREAFAAAIEDREAQGTTAVGGGIAIPHAKSVAVAKAGLCAVTLRDGADWGAPDALPARLVFMIAAPPDGNEHLEVLSRLVTMLMNKSISNALIGAETKEEFLKILEDGDAEIRKNVGTEEKTQAFRTHDGYRLVAVTACPTGIAHTYMAAEALRTAADGLGISIKVETDGSGGAKNVLTEEEIKAAEAVIIAADRQVEMSRFSGKHAVITGVGDGIHKAEDLILEAVSGKAPIYRHRGERKQSRSASDAVGAMSGWRAIYAYLMNGVSHMLPFVVAGGLFIAASFLIDTVSGVGQGANFGSGTPISAFVKTVGDMVFSFMLPVLAGYISAAVADRPAFLPGFVGGWLASLGSTFLSPGGTVSSGFLGALFAGFAAGFIMLALEKLCSGFPRSLEGLKPVLIYPLLGLTLIVVVMCGVNPLMGLINDTLYAFLNRLGQVSNALLGAILGAMMAFDMGGPVNKAAYVFGTAALASGNYLIMAAVMAGGMVPPLAIAIATSVFPRLFSPDERKNGAVNYILGLSFITEGAIPYAAADPLRVIPACMAGSATAGFLSMLFGCTLSAPHGGVFVFPVVGSALYYALSVLIGTVVSAVLLAIFKKSKTVK